MLHTLCIPYLHFKRECPVFVFVFVFQIAQDFLVMHGEASPKLCEMWLPEYAEKVLHLAKKDRNLPSFADDNMTPGKLKLT